MAINSVTSGIQTFLQAQQRLSASAEQIANATTSQNPQSLLEPLVDLRLAEQQAKAATKIIETENRIIGSLLDISA